YQHDGPLLVHAHGDRALRPTTAPGRLSCRLPIRNATRSPRDEFLARISEAGYSDIERAFIRKRIEHKSESASKLSFSGERSERVQRSTRASRAHSVRG